MHNVYEQFLQLLPDAPLQVGVVTEVDIGVVTVQLPGGGTVRARGSAAIGERVFVRDGVLEAVAPNLVLEIIEI
jgi:hypothetical protein